PNISESQGKQIVNYLIIQQKRREKLAAEASGASVKIGRNMVEQKCSFCHGLDRLYMVNKTREEWVRTVENMIGYSEQADFLSPHEKEAVIEFLSSLSSSRSEGAK
ncbi:hypothetical protein VU00_11911, partial [Candidatus Electrothrix marina]